MLKKIGYTVVMVLFGLLIITLFVALALTNSYPHIAQMLACICGASVVVIVIPLIVYMFIFIIKEIWS